MNDIPSEEEMVPRFQTSLPKSGTHLLSYIIRTGWFDLPMTRIITSQAPRMTGTFHFSPDFRHVQGHLAYTPEWEGLLVGRIGIFLYRDPRDILVSWYYFLNKCVDGHFLSTMNVGLNLKDEKDRMAAMIEHLHPFLRGFTPWLRHSNMYHVRYEDVLSNPEEALYDISVALKEPLDYLVERSKFRGGRTYRKAQPGNWKDEFWPHHKKAFEKKWGDILNEWGYA